MPKRYSETDLAALREGLEEYLTKECGVPATRRPFRCISKGHKDKHPSMSIVSGKHAVKCHACGWYGDVFAVAQEVEGLQSFPEAVEAVARALGQSLPEGIEEPFRASQKPQEPLYPVPSMPQHPNIIEAVQEAFMRLYSMEGRAGLAYLEARGFYPDDITRNGIGYVSDPAQLAPGMFKVAPSDYEQGFLVLPAMNAECTACHYATLRPLKLNPVHKEWNPTGTRALWHEWALTGDAAGKEVLVAEGIFDAMSLEIVAHDYDTEAGRLLLRDPWQRPYLKHPPVALLSTSGVRRFLALIYYTPAKKRPSRVVVSLDADTAGQEAAAELLAGLDALGVPCSNMRPFPDGCKDANEWLQHLRQVA